MPNDLLDLLNPRHQVKFYFSGTLEKGTFSNHLFQFYVSDLKEAAEVLHSFAKHGKVHASWFVSDSFSEARDEHRIHLNSNPI